MASLVIDDNPANWYVVHCQTQREAQVARTLPNELDLAVYLPAVRRPFHRKAKPAPLFPGYIFVKARLHGNMLRAINAVPGVLRLLAFGGLPQPVPEAIIDALRERVDRYNSQGGLPTHGFRPGETVCVTAGPLQGLEAVFLGPMQPSARVQILINFLGELREVEVDAADLSAQSPTLKLKRERRTRGKGRPIRR